MLVLVVYHIDAWVHEQRQAEADARLASLQARSHESWPTRSLRPASPFARVTSRAAPYYTRIGYRVR